MTEESAPPPPPPLSPPPAPELTTIGKYIARFRYEKPRPRESRVAAQRGDFWWTNSPRYVGSPSPSPPSTWASGGAFSFPDEELEGQLDRELAAEPPNKGEERPNVPAAAEDDGADSIESKLRRRLGVWDSGSSRGVGTRGELSAEQTPDMLQSWGAADWSSEDSEEKETDELVEGEDPEEVIERVRRRLGWGATVSGVAAMTDSRLKPLEFRLSIDPDRRETRLRQLKLKPPLSPSSVRQGQALDSFGYMSDSSCGSMDRERRHIDERFDEVVSSMSSGEAKPRDGREQAAEMEEKYEEKRSPVDESEEKMASHHGSVSSVGGSDTHSMHGALSPIHFTMRSSGSSMDSRRSQGAEQLEEPNYTLVTPIVATPASDHEEGLHFDSSSVADPHDSRVETEEKELKASCGAHQCDTFHQVPELPLLATASPARPELAVKLASKSNLSGRSSSSAHRSDKRNPSESTKTLDSLVSLVVHSWENDFFSESVGIGARQDRDMESSQTSNDVDDMCSATNTSAPQSVSIQVPSKCSSEDEETRNSVQEVTTTLPITPKAPQTTAPEETQPDHDDEEKEDSPVPGEENDKIVQMLLERIALLEEALHQIAN